MQCFWYRYKWLFVSELTHDKGYFQSWWHQGLCLQCELVFKVWKVFSLPTTLMEDFVKQKSVSGFLNQLILDTLQKACNDQTINLWCSLYQSVKYFCVLVTWFIYWLLHFCSILHWQIISFLCGPNVWFKHVIAMRWQLRYAMYMDTMQAVLSLNAS